MLLKNIGKYQTKDIEDVNPEILVSQTLKSTIEVTFKDEGDSANPNLLTARPARTHNTD